MAKRIDAEKTEKWLQSVDRVLAAGNALKYTIKSLQEGGPPADSMLDAIEAIREGMKSALRDEQAKYTKMMEPPSQGELGIEPEQSASPGPRALPPRRLTGQPEGGS